MEKKITLSIIFILIFSQINYAQTYSWQQIGEDINGVAAGDQSGFSVSLNSDGSIVSIGSIYNDQAANDAGSVRIYQNVEGSWQQIGDAIVGDAESDNFGFSLQLNDDGSKIIIGTPMIDGNGFTDSGIAKIYEKVGNNWLQIGDNILGEGDMDYTGYSVDICSDGTTIAVGAPGNSENLTYSGQVRVYKWNGNELQQVGIDLNGETAFDFYGCSVSLSSDGSILAVGAFMPSVLNSTPGSVYIYQNIEGEWQLMGNVIDGESNQDQFGVSVCLNSDGTMVAIGANKNSGNGEEAGHVRVFQYISDNWIQIGSDIDGEAPYDNSGMSVSLSNDGSIVAIGAYESNGSGYVRVFQNISNDWQQIGEDISGLTSDDYFGKSLTMSSDGSVLAVGAYGYDGNGTDAGQVRVFGLTTLNITEKNASNIFIYPNPSKGIFNLGIKKNIDVEYITIFDSFGRFIKSIPIESVYSNHDQMHFSMTEHPSGIYYIQIKSGFQITTLKLLNL